MQTNRIRVMSHLTSTDLLFPIHLPIDLTVPFPVVLIKLPEKVENKKMVITESSIQDVFQLYGQGVGKAVKASDLRKVSFHKYFSKTKFFTLEIVKYRVVYP